MVMSAPADGYRGPAARPGPRVAGAPEHERQRPNAFHVRPAEPMTHRFNRVGGLLWRLLGWHRLVMASSNRVLTNESRRLLAGTRTSLRGVTC
jgi:hypothetical protein